MGSQHHVIRCKSPIQKAAGTGVHGLCNLCVHHWDSSSNLRLSRTQQAALDTGALRPRESCARCWAPTYQPPHPYQEPRTHRKPVQCPPYFSSFPHLSLIAVRFTPVFQRLLWVVWYPESWRSSGWGTRLLQGLDGFPKMLHYFFIVMFIHIYVRVQARPGMWGRGRVPACYG